MACTRCAISAHRFLSTHHAWNPGAGGTHHAFACRGEGFCASNDIAVGAAAAMAEHGVERVLVIDLDVHQVRSSSAWFDTLRCPFAAGVAPSRLSVAAACLGTSAK